MQIILYTFQEALIALLLLLPVFAILNHYRFHNCIRTGMYLILATYLCAVYTIVGLPDISYYRFRLNMNLEPFLYMFSDMRSTVLNVVLFLPLGFLLPILWEDFRSFLKTILVGFLTSLTIELLQIFTYRATDINDLMTNTLGTVLGWCFGCIILHFGLKNFPERSRKNIHLVFAIPFGIMFFLHPPFSDFIYRLIK